MAMPRLLVNGSGHGTRAIRCRHVTLPAFPPVGAPPSTSAGRLEVSLLQRVARAQMGAALRTSALPLLCVRANVQHLHRNAPLLSEASGAVVPLSLVRRRAAHRARHRGCVGDGQGHGAALAASSPGSLAANEYSEAPRSDRGRIVLPATLLQGKPIADTTSTASRRAMGAIRVPAARARVGARCLGTARCRAARKHRRTARPRRLRPIPDTPSMRNRNDRWSQGPLLRRSPPGRTAGSCVSERATRGLAATGVSITTRVALLAPAVPGCLYSPPRQLPRVVPATRRSLSANTSHRQSWRVGGAGEGGRPPSWPRAHVAATADPAAVAGTAVTVGSSHVTPSVPVATAPRNGPARAPCIRRCRRDHGTGPLSLSPSPAAVAAWNRLARPLFAPPSHRLVGCGRLQRASTLGCFTGCSKPQPESE